MKFFQQLKVHLFEWIITCCSHLVLYALVPLQLHLTLYALLSLLPVVLISLCMLSYHYYLLFSSHSVCSRITTICCSHLTLYHYYPLFSSHSVCSRITTTCCSHLTLYALVSLLFSSCPEYVYAAGALKNSAGQTTLRIPPGVCLWHS